MTTGRRPERMSAIGVAPTTADSTRFSKPLPRSGTPARPAPSADGGERTNGRRDTASTVLRRAGVILSDCGGRRGLVALYDGTSTSLWMGALEMPEIEADVREAGKSTYLPIAYYTPLKEAT
ncbi:hypothetical protein O1611_g9983 [Lasiodiplodia mahajangana]|uniref:Uncharacterized protein n=1 Tax=Lasiodiplodia mahajangana TaxID=1108764 RepID=A0ACC2J3I1_9PEZI|nr:hypothetical protein O1611_g9983 [Lasiodiplodia mahajangana]